MCCRVSCGQLDNNSSYIWLAIFFIVVNSCFYGLNNNEIFETLKILNSNLSSHIIIRYFFNYLVICIIGLCLYLYDYSIIKKEKSSKELIEVNDKEKLIYNNPEEKMKTNKLVVDSLLLYLLWFIEELCLDYFIVSFKDVDCWMFELIYLALLTKKIFNKRIYKHQWFAILINLFSFILKIISIAITLFDTNIANYEMELPILYKTNPFFLFGFILYQIFIFLRAYVNVKLKWFMQIKYVPINKILLWHGFIGTVLSIICIIISSIFPCSENNIEDYNKNFNYSKYLCKIKINDTDSNITNDYLDNIVDYFDDWKTKDEILIIILGSLTFFLFRFFSLLVIKNLSPIHFFISIPVTFFFQKMMAASNTLYAKKKIFKDYDDLVKIAKLTLDVIGDFFAIIGFLIYLEIIVLKCCNLDHNIKENIMERAQERTLLDESLNID